ncbi:MAG: M23 family metallopeptidase [Bacteroidia bacterium]|nr:M23 family metallopeptidase [Bacteroidia bacterium]
MSKIRYKFNTRSLTYEKVEVGWKHRLYKILGYLATGAVFAVITVSIAFRIIDSPQEKQLRRELERMRAQYEVMNKKLDRMNLVMSDLQERDNNIYRIIFEAEPIPDNVRRAGFGGIDRYKELEGYENSALVISTSQKLDKLAKQMYIQSKSWDEVVVLAKNKEKMLSSIPAIQPVSNKSLRHAPGGFGWRTHPIYKTSEFHPGMDFACPMNTPIYATGDGVVERADAAASGYGNHVVINHSYGYKTLYAHMTKFNVHPGQKVKRGQVIGYVGSTGLSTAPHVHYEVIRNGNKVNPINFFFNDLTPEEYQILVQKAASSSQSFD